MNAKTGPTFLVCPVDRVPLKPADKGIVAKLNKAIAAGRVKNVAAKTVAEPMEGGLVCADEGILYPVVDGIPLLLPDEGISLKQIRGGEKS